MNQRWPVKEENANELNICLDNVGWTAMHYVISFTVEKKLRLLVPFLIKAGFNPNIRNHKEQTVFDLAKDRKNSKAHLFLEKAVKEHTDQNNNDQA